MQRRYSGICCKGIVVYVHIQLNHIYRTHPPRKRGKGYLGAVCSAHVIVFSCCLLPHPPLFLSNYTYMYMHFIIPSQRVYHYTFAACTYIYVDIYTCIPLHLRMYMHTTRPSLHVHIYIDIYTSIPLHLRMYMYSTRSSLCIPLHLLSLRYVHVCNYTFATYIYIY